MRPLSIHDRIGDKIELAQTYADDGAFYTAARVLREAADILQAHAEFCDPLLSLSQAREVRSS